MVEHGDKHGRNAVETGDPFLVDAGQGILCGKIGKRTQRCAVGHRSGHGKHHTEAMEHGNLYHHPVRGRQAHPVANAFAVIDNVIVCQHNAFRKTCCTGCILHVADIVRLDALGHGVQGLNRLHGFFKRQAALLNKTDCDHIPEERQLFAVQRRSGFCLGDLRT